MPGIVHINQPYWFGEGGDADAGASSGWRARARSSRRSSRSGPERVAAFIGEPVQGAGGVIIPPETYWPEIQRICDKYGILLVVRRGHLRLRPHRRSGSAASTSASGRTS